MICNSYETFVLRTLSLAITPQMSQLSFGSVNSKVHSGSLLFRGTFIVSVYIQLLGYSHVSMFSPFFYAFHNVYALLFNCHVNSQNCLDQQHFHTTMSFVVASVDHIIFIFASKPKCFFSFFSKHLHTI